jgi:coenzyme Q-binding protein COQ10
MHNISEVKILPFSPEQLFNLVMDIESYPTFLPFCTNAKIESKKDDEIIASLTINVAGLEKTYRSLVQANDNIIEVKAIDGPFKYLYNRWEFKAYGASTIVSFQIDFELESFLLSKLMDVLLGKIYNEILSAFEKKAEEKYGIKNSAD